jgi:ribosome assembly protein SQT1
VSQLLRKKNYKGAPKEKKRKQKNCKEKNSQASNNMSSTNPHQDADPDSDPELLDADDAAEVLEEADGDGDVAMDSDGEDEAVQEITLQNDSIAYFDGHKDSVFAIAQHPVYPQIIASGGSEGDADDAPGKGYVLNIQNIPVSTSERPVLPPSYAADATSAAAVAAAAAQAGNPTTHALVPIFEIDGHSDSITALTFTQPSGEFLVSGGMDGRIRAYSVTPSSTTTGGAPTTFTFTFAAEAQEIEDITWLAPCPTPTHDSNAIALGASDGSVWVYAVEPGQLRMVASYFLHTGACTAGAWTPDGALLATVSDDGSLHVFDVWGAATAAGVKGNSNGQTVVSLTEADQRFAVDGGLYSVAVAPSGAYLAVGGNGGSVKIVGLPKLSGGGSAKGGAKARGGAQRGGASDPSAQAGQILASLNVQSESVESLSFAPAPATLLAAGSVDGSIAVFDTARAFAVRRHLRGAHEDHSVVKVEFVSKATGGAAGWMLTSCGLDGVARRWDLRGAAGAAGAGAVGLVKEWMGHRGGGEGGGILGFVQGNDGQRVITAGDDGLVLVFEA